MAVLGAAIDAAGYGFDRGQSTGGERGQRSPQSAVCSAAQHRESPRGTRFARTPGVSAEADDLGTFVDDPPDLVTNELEDDTDDLDGETAEVIVLYPSEHGKQSVDLEEVEELREECERLRQDNERLRDDQGRLRQDHERLDQDHERLDQDHARLGEDHARLGEEHERLGEDLAAAKQQIEELNAQVASARYGAGIAQRHITFLEGERDRATEGMVELEQALRQRDDECAITRESEAAALRDLEAARGAERGARAELESARADNVATIELLELEHQQVLAQERRSLENKLAAVEQQRAADVAALERAAARDLAEAEDRRTLAEATMSAAHARELARLEDHYRGLLRQAEVRGAQSLAALYLLLGGTWNR